MTKIQLVFAVVFVKRQRYTTTEKGRSIHALDATVHELTCHFDIYSYSNIVYHIDLQSAIVIRVPEM